MSKRKGKVHNIYEDDAYYGSTVGMGRVFGVVVLVILFSIALACILN